MDYTEIIIKIITIIGAIVVALITTKQIILKTKKTKQIEDIQNLYDLKNKNPNNKWLVCEKFYQITDLKMNYSDICKLLESDNVLIEIKLLQKYKRVYEYKNGTLKYANEFENSKIQLLAKIIPKLSNWFFGIFLFLSAFVFAFSTSIQDKITFAIYMLVIAPYWIISITSSDDNRIAEKLIDTNKP